MQQFLKDLFKGQIYDETNFFLIAGPCVVESEELLDLVASRVSSLCNKMGIPYIFKASYRKANRTSSGSFTGIGDEQALSLVQNTGRKYKIPTTSDIHAHDEAVPAAAFVDVLQIPAFLCRQTDILVAAAETGKVINVKKGQFLSGPAMKFAAEKINGNITVTSLSPMP